MDWLRSKPAPETGTAANRQPHSIRFLEPEWQRIEAYAGDRGLTPSEFVRHATLSAIEEGDGVSIARLAPIVETTFRATYVLMSKVNDDMLEAGDGERLEALVAEAEEMQADLQAGDSNSVARHGRGI